MSPVLLKQYVQEKKRLGRVKKKSRLSFRLILSKGGGKYVKKEEHSMKYEFIDTRNSLTYYRFKKYQLFSSANKLLLFYPLLYFWIIPAALWNCKTIGYDVFNQVIRLDYFVISGWNQEHKQKHVLQKQVIGGKT